MSPIERLAIPFALVLALGCRNPAIMGSTTLRVQDKLDHDCVVTELKKQPTVGRVWGHNPIRFKFTPQGESKGYDFELHQDRVGLNRGWIFKISGKVPNKVADATALADDLGPEVNALRDAVANGCNAVILPAG